MRNAARILYCLLMTFFAIQAQAQQVFKTTKPSTIAYYEYLPQDYNTNSDKYPVVIFLHGIGERGPNTTDLAKLEQVIHSMNGYSHLDQTGAVLQLFYPMGTAKLDAINQHCFNNGVVLNHLQLKRKSLETKFFELTGKESDR